MTMLETSQAQDEIMLLDTLQYYIIYAVFTTEVLAHLPQYLILLVCILLQQNTFILFYRPVSSPYKYCIFVGCRVATVCFQNVLINFE